MYAHPIRATTFSAYESETARYTIKAPWDELFAPFLNGQFKKINRLFNVFAYGLEKDSEWIFSRNSSQPHNMVGSTYF